MALPSVRWLTILLLFGCQGTILNPGFEQDGAPLDVMTLPEVDAEGRNDALPTPSHDAYTMPDALLLSGDFCETGQLVAMEAESYSAQSGYSAISRADASGGFAMQVGDSGSLDFEIFLVTGGLYYFWIRTLAPDSESNGLYVALDGELITAPPDNPYSGVPDIYLRKSATEWFWDPAWQGSGSGAVQGPVTFVAPTGQHTLSILKRKMERPLIDKIVLTVAYATPTGFGPGETGCP